MTTMNILVDMCRTLMTVVKIMPKTKRTSMTKSRRRLTKKTCLHNLTVTSVVVKWKQAQTSFPLFRSS